MCVQEWRRGLSMCVFCARKRQNSCCGPGTPARDSPVARFDSRKSALSLVFDPSEISLRFPTARLRGFPGESRKKNLHFTVRDSRKCFDSRFSGSHRGRISRGLTWSESRFRPGQRPIETDRRKVARPRIPRSKARPRSGTRGRLAAAVGGPGQRNVRLTSQEFCDPRTKAHFPFFLSRTGPPLRS